MRALTRTAALDPKATLEALGATMRCVDTVIETVERLRSAGEDILLLIGSDHGQETIHGAIDIEKWLEGKGFATELARGEVAVAAQGTAALFYGLPPARLRLIETLQGIEDEPWADEIVLEEGLVKLGHAGAGGVIAAVNMGRIAEQNPFGVAGARWIALDPGNPKPVGCGQHGGWGSMKHNRS